MSGKRIKRPCTVCAYILSQVKARIAEKNHCKAIATLSEEVLGIAIDGIADMSARKTSNRAKSRKTGRKSK